MQQRGMFPRMTKSATPESFDEYLQAGTDGIFVDSNGRAVYYFQYVNATFADSLCALCQLPEDVDGAPA
jgi:hypothetical protein